MPNLQITYRILANLLVLCTFSLFASRPLYSQTLVPGVPVFDNTGFVEYIPGNLPIVISVPHGGDLEPENIPDRDCDAFTCGKDLFTQELGRSTLDAFFEQTGCYPHVIINLLHRRKFDANREIMEAADGNPIVEESFAAYHAFIETAKEQIQDSFGRGLFLDLHGHAHTIQRLELGYRLTRSQLQMEDAELNTEDLIERSSIRSLVSENISSSSHAELLRGEDSFGTLCEDRDIAAVPSAPMPFPFDNESYFTGGYNTLRHGSSEGGNIDAIQIECNQDIRFDTDTRDNFADSLVIIINDFINTHYDENFTSSFCNLISNTTIVNNLNTIDLYPNPVSDLFNIDSDDQEIEFTIYNCLGQNIMTGMFSGQDIDASRLKAGSYIVVFKKDGLYIGSSKLIKNER